MIWLQLIADAERQRPRVISSPPGCITRAKPNQRLQQSDFIVAALAQSRLMDVIPVQEARTDGPLLRLANMYLDCMKTFIGEFL